METTIAGYIGIMGFYRGNIGMMEKNMETTIMGYIRIIGYILGLYSFFCICESDVTRES